MNYKLSLFVFLFITLSIGLQAQGNQGNKNFKSGSTYKMSGFIIDSNTDQSLEFATIAVYDKRDSSVITGGLSDADGKFLFELSKKDVFVEIDFLSYQTYTIDDINVKNGRANLGKVILTPSSQSLEEIEITAERSENTFSLDKRVFTVGKDLANQGGSAEDILDNVPSVSVDIDGNVSLRGSDGVRILIDGRPSGLAGVGNTNGLRNIASNIIEKVEVITNPSARYEAEGMAGIINIVLKKNKSEGFNGSFDLSGGYPARTGLAANINYRKNKLNWFFNYGLRYRENPGGGFITQDQLIDGADEEELLRQITVQDREQNRTGLSNSFRFGADYFFSENEFITAAFLLRKSDEENFSTIDYADYIESPDFFEEDFLWATDVNSWKKDDYMDFESRLPSESLISRSRRTDDELEDEKNLEYSLNYEKQFSGRDHKLTGIVQFREKSEVESSDFNNIELYSTQIPNDFQQRSNNDEGEKTWLFQLDYVHPLGKDHKFEVGLRSSLREINNDFLVEENIDENWISLDGLSNNFIYNEDIQAAYAIYGNTINKFGFQAGIRTEYSLINTQLVQSELGGTNRRNFLNLFPSGHLNYNFTEQSALQISYSKRIRRPRFWDLNPFFTFSDNRNFFSGNPNVNPEFTDSYEIGQIQYWDNLTLSSSIFYRHTTGSIQRILTVDAETANTLRMPLNIGTVNDLGLDISFNYSGIPWLKLDANANIFRNRLTLDQEETSQAVFTYYQTVRNYAGSIEEFEMQYDYEFNETDNITWNGRLTARIDFWDSDFQIRTNYRGPRETSQGRSDSYFTIDIGWSKDLLNKKLTLTLGVKDLFNNRKRIGYTVLDDFFQYSEFQWRSRAATMTASYRINQKKKRNSDRDRGDFDDGGDF